MQWLHQRNVTYNSHNQLSVTYHHLRSWKLSTQDLRPCFLLCPHQLLSWTQFTFFLNSYDPGASLVVQWLRICLAMQWTLVGSLPRKIPHAVEQLSPCTTTTEPMCLEPVLYNWRSHHSEKPVQHPLTTTREEPTSSNEHPAHPKRKYIKIK